MTSNQAMREEFVKKSFSFNITDDEARAVADWWLERWPKEEERFFNTKEFLALAEKYPKKSTLELMEMSEAKLENKCVCDDLPNIPHKHHDGRIVKPEKKCICSPLYGIRTDCPDKRHGFVKPESKCCEKCKDWEFHTGGCPCHAPDLSRMPDMSEMTKNKSGVTWTKFPDLKIDWARDFKDKWEGANTGSPLSSLVIMDMVADIKDLLSQKESQVLSKVKEVVEQLRGWELADNPKEIREVWKEGRESALSDILSKISE